MIGMHPTTPVTGLMWPEMPIRVPRITCEIPGLIEKASWGKGWDSSVRPGGRKQKAKEVVVSVYCLASLRRMIRSSVSPEILSWCNECDKRLGEVK